LEGIANITDISERLKKLVTYYNKHRAKYFLACLENKESLADCVTGCLNKGQLSCTHDAKFHSHIRRFPSHREGVLEVANKIKEEEVLNGTINDFEDLIGRINALYGYADKGKNHVKYFGPLYIYDTAIRIGYHLTSLDGNRVRFMPDKYVYLQAGTLTGAMNLLGKEEVMALIAAGANEQKGKGLENLKIVNTQALLAKRPELDGLVGVENSEGLKEKPEEPTKALIIEDFFCVMEDYLGGAATRPSQAAN
jgi:hypothetical protein